MDEEYSPNHDYLLSTLYRTFTDAGAEFGVTVLVGGSWITGMAIAGRAWMEQVGKFIDDQTGTELGLVFRTIGQTLYPADSEIEAGHSEAVPEDRPTAYLHLRDARSVDPSGLVPDTGGLIRLRFSAVDGWLMGNLAPQGYKPPPPPI